MPNVLVSTFSPAFQLPVVMIFLWVCVKVMWKNSFVMHVNLGLNIQSYHNKIHGNAFLQAAISLNNYVLFYVSFVTLMHVTFMHVTRVHVTFMHVTLVHV